MEPVYFYDDECVKKRLSEYKKHTHDVLTRKSLVDPRGSGYDLTVKTPLGIKPNQIGQYSENHPTLMNVQNWHNVRVMDLAPPRIFIQISYDIHFDEIVAKDINTRIL